MRDGRRAEGRPRPPTPVADAPPANPPLRVCPCRYPHDSHVLTIAFATTDVNGVGTSSAELVWSPVSCRFAGGREDEISGWSMDGVLGREFEAYYRQDDLREVMLLGSNLFYSLYRNIKRSLGNDFLALIDRELTQEKRVSYAACDIRIVRNTQYFVLNFVLMIALFTVVSFVVFCVAITEVHDRCAISITIVLALNVYQLIVNDSMPKTNYLNPSKDNDAPAPFQPRRPRD